MFVPTYTYVHTLMHGEVKGVGFTEQNASTKGHTFVTELRDVLWAIDTHLHAMAQRGKHVR